MLDSVRVRRWIGRIAWIAVWVGLVGGQLHALARHATADGQADLELWTTRSWAVPAAQLLAPMLSWANPDVVYLTYGKVWFLVSAATAACAFLVHRLRAPQGFEKWAWRVALTGYVASTIACFLDYWTQWTAYNVFIEIALAISIPAMVLELVGSTLLGIALLRQRFRPRAVPWLLVAYLPFAIAITYVTSLGNVGLLVLLAFGLLGRRIARDPSGTPVARWSGLGSQGDGRRRSRLGAPDVAVDR